MSLLEENPSIECWDSLLQIYLEVEEMQGAESLVNKLDLEPKKIALPWLIKKYQALGWTAKVQEHLVTWEGLYRDDSELNETLRHFHRSLPPDEAAKYEVEWKKFYQVLNSTPDPEVAIKKRYDRCRYLLEKVELNVLEREEAEAILREVENELEELEKIEPISQNWHLLFSKLIKNTLPINASHALTLFEKKKSQISVSDIFSIIQ